MSGVDPNAAGVIVVGGGGSSLPTATAAGQVPVSSGASTTYTAKGRRLPTGIGTPALWWKCTETSGTTLTNSGSTSSADLTVQAAGVLCQRRAGSPFPYGLECTGSAASEARGAGGIAVGDGSALTVWAWAVVDTATSAGARTIVCKDHNNPGSGWTAPYVDAMIACGTTSGVWTVAINVGGTYRDITVNAARDSWIPGVCHLFGLTWDGTTLTAWLDGRAVSTSTPGAGSISFGGGTSRWHVGNNDSNELFDGTIFEAGAFASVLTPTQWADAFARGIGFYGAT